MTSPPTAALQRLLEALPADYPAVVRALAAKGRPVEEIAVMMRISKRDVQMLLAMPEELVPQGPFPEI